MDDHDRLRSHVLELRTLMASIWNAGMRHIDQWLAEHDLPLNRIQLGVLRFLHHEGDRTQSEMSKAFGLDPSTLVPVVDALEEQGYVQRTRDPNDRRRMPIALTDAGREMVASLPVLDENDPMLLALQQFEPDEIESLINAVCRIARHMPGTADDIAASHKRIIAFGAQEEHLICRQRIAQLKK